MAGAAFEVRTFFRDVRGRFARAGSEAAENTAAEMRRQLDLVAEAARRNISTSFQNPNRLLRAVGTAMNVSGGQVIGEVDATGRLTEVGFLPYAGILEEGGVIPRHYIEGHPYLSFFWEREDVWFFGPRVDHPGATVPARRFLARALEERLAAMPPAFAAAFSRALEE